MRNPLRRAVICLGWTVLGVVLVFLGIFLHERLGQETIGAIIGIMGFTTAVIALFVCMWAAISVPGYNRLRAGQGVIARWHLSAAEWDGFRALDKIRADQHIDLRNDMRMRNETPPEGVEVIVGERQIIVDGSYHRVHRFVPGRAINWLVGDPECIEFPSVYSRGRSGMLHLTLRIPVAASARAEALRVYEHYKALRPQAKKA